MRDFAKLQAQRWLLGVAGRAGLAVLFAALLAFLAPFGTYQFATVELIGYWTIQMAAWLVLSQAVAWILAQVPAVRSRPAVQQRVAAVLIAALPMMVVTGIANNMLSGWQPEPGEVAELFVSITLIGGAYTFLADWLMADMLAAQAQPTGGSDVLPFAVPDAAGEGVSDGVAAPDNALIDRLPAHIRADILCLQVEDHYVRVHGRHGSAMVLMRFSDALRGIDHLAGSQVHRSWWVATDAVAALRRTGRTAQLTLLNGTSVPVSQPYLAYAVRTWGGLPATGD